MNEPIELFKAGDVVRLRGGIGGPRMVVTGVQKNGAVEVVWPLNNDDVRQGVITTAAIERASARELKIWLDALGWMHASDAEDEIVASNIASLDVPRTVAMIARLAPGPLPEGALERLADLLRLNGAGAALVGTIEVKP